MAMHAKNAKQMDLSKNEAMSNAWPVGGSQTRFVENGLHKDCIKGTFGENVSIILIIGTSKKVSIIFGNLNFSDPRQKRTRRRSPMLWAKASSEAGGGAFSEGAGEGFKGPERGIQGNI